MIYPFTESPLPVDFETAEGIFRAYRLLKERGGYKRLSKEEKTFVASFFRELSHPEAYREGIYRCVGWVIDFRSFLRRFLVNYKHYGWCEIWAFNKTTLRRNSVHPHDILEIIEIPAKRGA